jgi:hypothetical protein
MQSNDEIKMTAKIESMYVFVPESSRYAKGALLFMSYAKAIEEDNEHPDRFLNYHLNCVSSILFSYLALEAHVNEFFYLLTNPEQFSEEFKIHKYAVDEKIRGQIAYFINLEKDATLDKYSKLALLLIDSILEKNHLLYQNVNLLTRLRNLLMHYKMNPSAIVMNGDLVDDIQDLEKKLNGRFPLNSVQEDDIPFFRDKLAYFPDKVVGYGAAYWAYKAMYDFVADFHTQVALPSHSSFPILTE